MTTKSPPVIYRYQPMRPDALDLLRHGRLWFSDPGRFNDPFDFLPDFSAQAKELVDGDREAAFWSDSSITGGKEAFMKATQALRDKRVRDVCHQMHNKFRKNLGKNFWVACFSEVTNSILMWSHYAACHTGICFGIRPERMELQPDTQILHVGYFPKPRR